MNNYCLRYTFIICFIFIFMNVNAQYETIRLKRIGDVIGITGDSIQEKSTITNLDSTILFRNRILNIKANKWGEICHIGYSLFPTEVRDSSWSYIYDFVERYLLELDLLEKNNDVKKQLRADDILLDGDFPDILDELSTDYQVTIENLKYHRYDVNYKRGESRIRMEFTPNCQLMLGANDKELEEVFSRKFRLFLGENKDSVQYSLVIDMYGNKKDSIKCTLYDLLCYIEQEQCQMIFGQDEDGNDIMFAINEQLDYIHLAILKENHAYIYVYIPIHTFPEFFINQIKEEQ